MKNEQSFLSLAMRREVAGEALKIAIVVGTVLCLINQTPAYMNDEMSHSNMWQILLTYLVPYCVATYSSVKVMRKFMK